MSTSNSSCSVPDEFWTHKYNAYYFSYYILTPVYFISGLLGHSLCLLAFYRQAKKESTYAYQIFVALSETAEIVAFGLFSVTFRWWSGIENGGRGAGWYMRSRWLMIYAANVSFPLLNGVLTTTLLLSLCMSADRLVALWRPFVYKRMNHRKYQSISLIGSCLIGVSTSVFDGFRFRLIEQSIGPRSNSSLGDDRGGGEGGEFRAIGDLVYMNSLSAIFLAHLRDAIRISGLVALITCNVFIVNFYRRRTIRWGSLTGSADDDHRRRTADHRRQREKTLVLLTVSQSILTSAGTSFLILFYALVYANPTFLTCGGLLMAPILDATLQLASIVDIFIVIAIDRRFRRMIWKAIPRAVRRRLRSAEGGGAQSPVRLMMVMSPSGLSKSSGTTSAFTSRDVSTNPSRRGSAMIGWRE